MTGKNHRFGSLLCESRARRDINAYRRELASADLRAANDRSKFEREQAQLSQELTEHQSRRTIVITAPSDGTATAVLADRGQTAGPQTVLLSELEVKPLQRAGVGRGGARADRHRRRPSHRRPACLRAAAGRARAAARALGPGDRQPRRAAAVARALARAAASWRSSAQYDLRFSDDEVTALVRSSGSASLRAGASRELLERTDGWAAGLRLSLSARPGGAPRGRRRADAAPPVRLPRQRGARRHAGRAAPVPAALLGAARAHRRRAAPHVSRCRAPRDCSTRWSAAACSSPALDADEPTLRLHDLFRDFLEDRLHRDHADEVPDLLRRAADDEPDLTRAVGYLTRAGAWDEAGAVLADPARPGAGHGRRRAGRRADARAVPRRPVRAACRPAPAAGLTTFPRFDFDGMVAAMQRAADGYAREGRRQDAALARAYACIGMENTGHLHEAAQRARRACASSRSRMACAPSSASAAPGRAMRSSRQRRGAHGVGHDRCAGARERPARSGTVASSHHAPACPA